MLDIMDLHTHTIASGHAYNTLYEMARSASEKGLKLFGSTDHAPKMPGTCHEFYFQNVRVIPRRLFGVQILIGAELNILDATGKIDLREGILKRLDYTIASIHQPCYQGSSVTENTSAYLGAIENPYVNIIGHPDDGRYLSDYDTLAAAAAQHGKLLELNNSSLHPIYGRNNARENSKRLLEYCRKYKTSIIIDSDAHVETDVGNHQRAWDLIREIEFPEELIVNSSLDKLLSFIPKLEEKNDKFS
ncbi:MAG TPA: phosphatase [Candidatus Hungatella pullicola]|nr:phosphatase [Candidatus Hungatella pullicola]